MRYRIRVFLVCFVPFAVLLAASFWLVQQMAQSTVRDSLRASLRESELAIARVHAKADAQNGNFLKIAGENAALKAGLQLLRSESGNPAARRTLEDQLRELGEHMGVDFLLVSAPSGAPLAGVVRQRGVDGKTQLVPADTVLFEHGNKGLMRIGGRTFQFASVPLDVDDGNIGSLSVGEYFDFPGPATPALLMNDGKVIQSNIPNASPAAVEAALGGCGGQTECDFRLRGVNWISVPTQLFGGGYVLRSLENVDEATAPVQARLRNLFLAMAFGSMIIALLCSIVSSRSIVRPIAQVVSHLRNAERTGELPGFTAELSSTREIRELVQSYNRAAGSVRHARENLQRAYVEFTGSLASALDARDRYTSGHSYRVSLLSCETAAAMGLGPERVERIRIGAQLHDIGKIGIADSVLQKPGKLTAEEFDMIKEHPVIGRRILEGVQVLAPYLEAVELHHENWDGTGYPKGLSGEETPIDARIIHVSDAYDAMTSDRSYRRGMTHQQAIRILSECAGTQFDRRIVDVFLKLPFKNAAGTEQPKDDLRQAREAVAVEAG